MFYTYTNKKLDENEIHIFYRKADDDDDIGLERYKSLCGKHKFSFCRFIYDFFDGDIPIDFKRVNLGDYNEPISEKEMRLCCAKFQNEICSESTDGQQEIRYDFCGQCVGALYNRERMKELNTT